MKEWLSGICGALGMGLIWAAGWGLVGVLIGMFVDPHGSIDDMWVVTLGVPGFLGGVVFSAVLGIAEGRRRFDELSLSQFGAWGAVAALLLGAVSGQASWLLCRFTGFSIPLGTGRRTVDPADNTESSGRRG